MDDGVSLIVFQVFRGVGEVTRTKELQAVVDDGVSLARDETLLNLDKSHAEITVVEVVDIESRADVGVGEFRPSEPNAASKH